MGEYEKKKFQEGLKDATSNLDLKDVASKAAEMLGAGADSIGQGVSRAAGYLSGSSADSGGFLGDKDRYDTKKKK